MQQQLNNPIPDQATVEQFERDGAIVLRGLFSDWIDPLAEGIETLMADPSPLERSYNPADGSAPFFQDLCNWQRIKSFEDFVYSGIRINRTIARKVSRASVSGFHLILWQKTSRCSAWLVLIAGENCTSHSALTEPIFTKTMTPKQCQISTTIAMTTIF